MRVEGLDCFNQKPSSIVTSVFFITNRPLGAQFILDECIALISLFNLRATCHRHHGPQVLSSASRTFRHSGTGEAFKTTFEVFPRVGPDNSLEGLTERSVGLIAHRPGNVDELFVALFK